MIFASSHFLLFFVLVFLVYWHSSHKFQNYFLLLASYYFYACWDWRFLSLIIFCTVVNYYCGNKLFYSTSRRAKKIWLTLSVSASLLVLFYFKYTNFFLANLTMMLNVFGVHLSKTTLDITLPVGISFYTFQSMTYALDLYIKDTYMSVKSFISSARGNTLLLTNTLLTLAIQKKISSQTS